MINYSPIYLAMLPILSPRVHMIPYTDTNYRTTRLVAPADHLILRQVLTGRKVKPSVPVVAGCRSGMGLDARLQNLIQRWRTVC